MFPPSGPEGLLPHLGANPEPNPKSNPKGIAPHSPGLRETRYPGNRVSKLFRQPQRGCGVLVVVRFVNSSLSDNGIPIIAATYHAWRSLKSEISNLKLSPYKDTPGFCKSATLEEIRQHNHVLTPGRYVGAASEEDDGEPFEKKMKRLRAELEQEFAESAKLEHAIRENLKTLKYA